MDADQKATAKQAEESRAKEFRLRFYEKQLSYLVELSDAVSRLASAEKAIDGKKDFALLEAHYYGQLLVMGNEAISENLSAMLHLVADGMKKPEQEFDAKTRASLALSSIRISRQCRLLLEKTFELDHLNHGEVKPLKIDWKH